MRTSALIIIGIFATIAMLRGQNTGDLRITAQTLSSQTTSAMFGRLPKAVTAASVQVCNNLATTVTLPQARIVQQVKSTNGYTILPKDAAIVVVAASQGKSPSSTALRIGIGVISLAAIASGWSGLSSTIKNTLNSASISGALALNVIGTTISTHTFLTFSNEMLPDPLALPAMGCVSGYALVEADAGAKSIDFSMPIAAGEKQ